MRFKMFCTNTIVMVPKIAPKTSPRPPAKEIPPTTAAAIADSSSPFPRFGDPAANRAVNRMAAIAVRSPDIPKAISLIWFDLRPVRLAAVRFPPTA